MRLIGYILSFHFLVLFITPCIDNAQDYIAGTEVSTPSEEHEHEETDCSPFCTCHCCGIANVFIIKNTASYIENKVYTKVETLYSFSAKTAPEKGIWQPPKIV